MVLHYGICIRTRDLKIRMFYIVFHGNKNLSVIFIDHHNNSLNWVLLFKISKCLYISNSNYCDYAC